MKSMWKSIRNRIKCLNDEGSALLTVILIITFLTILATILLYITGMNFQIKQADYQNKKNFYTGEEALEEIKTNLIMDISKAAVLANEEMACNYAGLSSEELRVNQYNNFFVEHLQEIWDDKLAVYGSWDALLNSYHSNHTDFELEMDLVTYDANGNGSLSSDEALDVVANSGMIYIRGLKIKYVNPDNKLTTKISTDFRITAPAIDWSANAALTALPDGVDAAAAGKKELVTPKDSIVYTNWKKE